MGFMSDWKIELNGDEGDMSFLETLLAKSPYNIETDGPFKRLNLPAVAPDADSETVRSAAAQLVEVVNGAARLYYKRFGGVRFSQVTILDSDGKRRGYGYLTARARNHTLTAVSSADQTMASWVSLALADTEVSRALGLYGALEPNWKNLYMVLEVIEDDLGGEAQLKSSGFLQAGHLDAFKHTANSYNAVGRETRHATLSREPPAKPMSITEAREFVQDLLRAWLRQKQPQSA